MIKLKKLFMKEETDKRWIIYKQDGSMDPYQRPEMVGVVRAGSSSDALQKYYQHENISEDNQEDFSAGEATTSLLAKYRQYWEGKKELAVRAIQNMNI